MWDSIAYRLLLAEVWETEHLRGTRWDLQAAFNPMSVQCPQRQVKRGGVDTQKIHD